jgi:hypothetical protein
VVAATYLTQIVAEPDVRNSNKRKQPMLLVRKFSLWLASCLTALSQSFVVHAEEFTLKCTTTPDQGYAEINVRIDPDAQTLTLVFWRGVLTGNLSTKIANSYRLDKPIDTKDGNYGFWVDRSTGKGSLTLFERSDSQPWHIPYTCEKYERPPPAPPKF